MTNDDEPLDIFELASGCFWVILLSAALIAFTIFISSELWKYAKEAFK